MKINILTKYQTGYTLVELMIAGVLGLIILLGVMQVYLGASQTNRLQAGVIEVQDSGRFALTYLEKDLQRAGWSSYDPDVKIEVLDTHIYFNGLILNFDPLPLAALNGVAAGNNFSDSLTLIYEADDETGVDVKYNCGGNPIDATAIFPSNLIVNRYSVNNNGELICTGYSENPDSIDTQVILNNVASFQVLYGVDDFNQPDGIVDGYLTADLIAGYEELVISIRIGILLQSSNNVLSQDTTNSYQVLDRKFTVTAANNRKLHRLYTKTILLPNRPTAF